MIFPKRGATGCSGVTLRMAPSGKNLKHKDYRSPFRHRTRRPGDRLAPVGAKKRGLPSRNTCKLCGSTGGALSDSTRLSRWNMDSACRLMSLPQRLSLLNIAFPFLQSRPCLCGGFAGVAGVSDPSLIGTSRKICCRDCPAYVCAGVAGVRPPTSRVLNLCTELLSFSFFLVFAILCNYFFYASRHN